MSFRNEPILELRRAPARDSLLQALRELDTRLPLEVPILIGGDRGDAAGLDSTDPGAPTAWWPGPVSARSPRRPPPWTPPSGFREWSARSAAQRAEVLRRAAATLRERRLELAALQVRECAKPWGEADADVCEAIDFLEYYADQAVEMERGRELVQVPGERNTMRYHPRGVAVVIAPWNFPLAIPCGMTAAALAAGNAAVLKPAEQSPPAPAPSWRPSTAPGCRPTLWPRARLRRGGRRARTRPASARDRLHRFGRGGARDRAHRRGHRRGQGHIKRVVSEMGGKNCVIVDSDADLDDVVPELIHSAFGFAGQKCSAASRALVHEAVAETLVERLSGAVNVLEVGQAESFASEVGPVIDQEAQERVQRYRDEAGSRIAAAAEPVPGEGWFVPPTVAFGLPEDSPVNREEIFGPLLSVTAVRDVDEAMDVVDSLPLALTGGLFSRSPATIERVAARSPVGNLYVNRGITGAMVGRQPFGGNRRSGIGSKAGGPDYLYQFVEPRVLTENTMRHGIPVE